MRQAANSRNAISLCLVTSSMLWRSSNTSGRGSRKDAPWGNSWVQCTPGLDTVSPPDVLSSTSSFPLVESPLPLSLRWFLGDSDIVHLRGCSEPHLLPSTPRSNPCHVAFTAGRCFCGSRTRPFPSPRLVLGASKTCPLLGGDMLGGTRRALSSLVAVSPGSIRKTLPYSATLSLSLWGVLVERRPSLLDPWRSCECPPLSLSR